MAEDEEALASALAAWLDEVRCYGYDPDVVLRLTQSFLETLSANPAVAGALMLTAKRVEPWDVPGSTRGEVQ